MRRSGMPMHCGISWLTDLTSGHGATWTSVSRRKPVAAGPCVRAVAAIDLSVSHRAGAASAGDAAAALQKLRALLGRRSSAELSTGRRQIAHLRAQAWMLMLSAVPLRDDMVRPSPLGMPPSSSTRRRSFSIAEPEAEAQAGLVRDALSSGRTIPGRQTPECAACRSQRARDQLRARLHEESRRSGCLKTSQTGDRGLGGSRAASPRPSCFYRAEAQRQQGRGSSAHLSAFLRDGARCRASSFWPRRGVAELDAGAAGNGVIAAGSRKQPVYQRWWFWTSITFGVVTVLGVALATSSPPTPYPNLRIVQLPEASVFDKAHRVLLPASVQPVCRWLRQRDASRCGCGQTTGVDGDVQSLSVTVTVDGTPAKDVLQFTAQQATFVCSCLMAPRVRCGCRDRASRDGLHGGPR